MDSRAPTLSLSAERTPLLTLPAEVVKNLTTYEDHLSLYIQLEETSTSFSWLKADVLAHMEETCGQGAPLQLSSTVGVPPGTISNYIRVARAFPPEKRDPGASFSLHFQASFADKYNEKTGTFATETRFKWRDKSIDNNLSTRSLHKEIRRAQIRAKEKVFPCMLCGNTEGTMQYALYAVLLDEKMQYFYLDKPCYKKLCQFLYGKKNPPTTSK